MPDRPNCTELSQLLQKHKGFKRLAKAVAADETWDASYAVRETNAANVRFDGRKWVAALRRLPGAMVRELLIEVAALCEGDDEATKGLLNFVLRRRCSTCCSAALTFAGLLDTTPRYSEFSRATSSRLAWRVQKATWRGHSCGDD